MRRSLSLTRKSIIQAAMDKADQALKEMQSIPEAPSLVELRSSLDPALRKIAEVSPSAGTEGSGATAEEPNQAAGQAPADMPPTEVLMCPSVFGLLCLPCYCLTPSCGLLTPGCA